MDGIAVVFNIVLILIKIQELYQNDTSMLLQY